MKKKEQKRLEKQIEKIEKFIKRKEKEERKEKFNLIDYKGKWDIIQDKGLEDDNDIIVGEITREEAIKQAKNRKEKCLYYGIPAYIGEDKELNKIYE